MTGCALRRSESNPLRRRWQSCARAARNLQIELHVGRAGSRSRIRCWSVGDVGGIRGTPLFVIEVVDDHTHRQPQETIDLPIHSSRAWPDNR